MGIYNDSPLDKLSGEEIRQLFDRAVQDEFTSNERQREDEAARDFVEAHPEYIPNKRNGGLLQTAIDYSGTKVQTFEDIEKVYNDMRERGLLDLDASVIAQQEKDARQARITRVRNIRTVQGREITAEDLENQAWSMPLEQLIAIANEDLREQESGGMPMPGFDEPRPSGLRSRRRSGI